jgi:hypothetical protein
VGFEGVAMLIGKRFKLEISTLAASEVHRNRKLVLVTIPAGDTVTVVDASGDKMATVLWQGRTLFMFISDLERRATEVSQETAGRCSGPQAVGKVPLKESP